MICRIVLNGVRRSDSLLSTLRARRMGRCTCHRDFTILVMQRDNGDGLKLMVFAVVQFEK